MGRTGKNCDGIDRTGKRGHDYLISREAGMTVKELAAKFRVT
jgi:hypothetical protein